MIAQSTAPTGDVVEAGEVSELVLGVAASLHHEGGPGAGTLMGSPDSIPGRVPTAEAEMI